MVVVVVKVMVMVPVMVVLLCWSLGNVVGVGMAVMEKLVVVAVVVE